MKIVRDSPNISDHVPIVVEIFVCGEKSLDSVLSAAKELNQMLSNHTKILTIDNENTDLLNNLLKNDLVKCDLSNRNINDMCQFLSSKIQNYGKDERKPSIRRSVFNEVQVVSNVSASIVIGKNEIEKCCKKLERQQRNMAITEYERRNLGNVSVHALAE